MNWINRFYRWLFPSVPPLTRAQFPRPIVFFGGPLDGKTMRLTLKTGDMLHFPQVTRASVDPSALVAYVPTPKATYRIYWNSAVYLGTK